MKWGLLGQIAGKLVDEKVKENEKQLDRAWDLFRAYAPPETVAQVDRGLAFAALGLDPTSTHEEKEITDAYKVIARECHPDKTTDKALVERYIVATAARDLLLKKTP